MTQHALSVADLIAQNVFILNGDTARFDRSRKPGTFQNRQVQEMMAIGLDEFGFVLP